jgi:hypothetical protein
LQGGDRGGGRGDRAVKSFRRGSSRDNGSNGSNGSNGNIPLELDLWQTSIALEGDGYDNNGHAGSDVNDDNVVEGAFPFYTDKGDDDDDDDDDDNDDDNDDEVEFASEVSQEEEEEEEEKEEDKLSGSDSDGCSVISLISGSSN